MKVFLPYITFNTVFENERITQETGKQPVPFSAYSYPLLQFSKQHNFQYPYQAWPEERAGRSELSSS